MTTQTLPKSRSLSEIVGKSKRIDELARRILLKKLEQLKFGRFIIEDESMDPKCIFSFGDPESSLIAKILVKKTSFYSRTLIGGSIGNAESYIDGDWDTHQLTELIRIFVLNRHLLQNLDTGIGNLFRPIQKVVHGLRSNTIEGSRKNIKAHYDIGNDFFKLFLDESMMYSSALFDTQSTTLEEASLKKVKTICEKLELKASDHLIEIGTGWGTLAIYAATHYGCKVTTTTISRQQFEYASEEIKKRGLEDKITLLLQDYRHLTGSYDKLVSVEMIEAVGLENLPIFFEKCSSLLKPNGLMVLQAITIRDQFYESAKNSVDFIQRHIFPGGGIPSLHAMLNAITEKTDLILIQQKDHAEDYAQTLLHWSHRLEKNETKIQALGYPSFLYRLWQYYFSYCEGGFRERAIGVSQLTFSKPLYRNRSLL